MVTFTIKLQVEEQENQSLCDTVDNVWRQDIPKDRMKASDRIIQGPGTMGEMLWVEYCEY